MKKLILIATVFMSIFSVSAGVKYLKDEAPAAGSAADFFINFIKTAPQTGLEDARKHATKSQKQLVTQDQLKRYATVDFKQAFKWIEKPKSNGFVTVKVRYTYSKGSLADSLTVKKINGKWMIAGEIEDKDK